MIDLFGKWSFEKEADKRESSVCEILDANNIFQLKKYNSIFYEIKTLTKLFDQIPNKYFDTIYTQLIHNYANFVQLLPIINNSKHSLLEVNLCRALWALQCSDKYEPPKNTSSISEEKWLAVWRYAIFSAALLNKISFSFSKIKIDFCDSQGKKLHPWSLVDNDMVQSNYKYFVFRIFNKQVYTTNLLQKLSIILARNLMSRESLCWLASVPEIFVLWLFAIEYGNDNLQGGNISFILRDASNFIEELFGGHNTYNLLLKNKKNFNSEGQDVSLSSLLAKNIKMYDDVVAIFSEWLIKYINKNRSALNNHDSLIHLTEEGIFIEFPSVLQDFCKSYPRFKHWVVVAKQFNHLGLSKRSGSDFVFEKYISSDTKGKILKKGMILHYDQFNLPQDILALRTRDLSSSVAVNNTGIWQSNSIQKIHKRNITLHEDKL